jgi:cytochrome c oxidase assembly protein subunit 11
MLIVCKIHAKKALYAILQLLDEKTYLRIIETQTKCSSDHGAITCAFPQEKQHYNVLYSQHNPGNSSIFIWLCTNVQNGAPLSASHQ